MDRPESEFVRVAREVLKAERRPLGPREIYELGSERGMWSDKLFGKTPYQTLKSKISVHIRTRGGDSEFIRTSPGKFFLRSLAGGVFPILTAPVQQTASKENDTLELPLEQPNSVSGPYPIYNATPLSPPHTRENVLCFDVSALDRAGRFQGIRKSWNAVALALLADRHTTYIERKKAESVTTHKQVLTYIMIRRPGQVLAFKRGSFTWTEAFLRGSHCIGFGGHVTEADIDLFNTDLMGVRNNARRELSEELELPRADRERLERGEGLSVVGLLNDDSSVAGLRHFAFLFTYDVCNPREWDSPRRGEKSITQLRWVDLGGSRPAIAIREFEYWSQLCLREYFSNTVKAQASYLVRRRRPLAPPHTLCLVGQIGSGKTEAADVLKRDYGYKEVNSGRVLASLLDLPPVPKSPRATFQKAALAFMQRSDGAARLAEAIWREARRVGGDRLLVDGIRHIKTLKAFQKLSKKHRVGLIYVHTPPDLSYKFFKRRGGESLSMLDFFRRRSDRVEQDVPRMIGMADAILYNWESRPRYRAMVHNLCSELGIRQ